MQLYKIIVIASLQEHDLEVIIINAGFTKGVYCAILKDKQSPFYLIKRLRMKFSHVIFMLSLSISSLISAEGVYQTELKNFEQSSARAQIMFSDEAPLGLPQINKEIEIYKLLTPMQRLIRCVFLSFNPIIITPENMPQLYKYISDLCSRSDVAMPTVFIVPDKGFFNAAAQKLFASTGAIIIGKDIIEKTNDRQIEAIIAHEIGHIKHNHVNKILALTAASAFAISMAKKYLMAPRYFRTQNEALIHGAFDGYLTAIYAGIIASFIINKKFEKEADQFACDNDKAEGIAEFFQYLEEKEQKMDEQFEVTYQALADNKSALEISDYYSLKLSYGLSKGLHVLNKGFKWLYHYTPFGAHPAHKYRIAAAQDYLKQAEAQLADFNEEEVGHVQEMPLDYSISSDKN